MACPSKSHNVSKFGVLKLKEGWIGYDRMYGRSRGFSGWGIHGPTYDDAMDLEPWLLLRNLS